MASSEDGQARRRAAGPCPEDTVRAHPRPLDGRGNLVPWGGTATSDVEEFSHATRHYLRAHRVVSTVVLSTVDRPADPRRCSGPTRRRSCLARVGRAAVRSIIGDADAAAASALDAGSRSGTARRAPRDRGAEEILLFTDLGNPTSNALYARLGFVGVLDVVDAALVPVARKNV